MSGLADVILGNPDDVARVPQLRQGIVTAVNPLMVRVGAAATSLACRALASVSANVGDCVSVLIIAGDRLVLGKASQSSMAPLNLGANNYGGGYRGLNWNGDYLIMSEGTNTFVSTPSAGGFVSIRGGINNGYQLNINADGNHTMVGHLTTGGHNIDLQGGISTANGFNLYGTNSFYFASYGGGWYMTDGTWIRSTNAKNVWLAGGWYGCDGGISIGRGGAVDGTWRCDIAGNGRFDGQVNAGGFQGGWFNGSSLDLNSGIAMNQSIIYFASRGDSNHRIDYSSAINGVELTGYATVRIGVAQTGMIWDFYASNWASGNWRGQFINDSSITLKENIEPLAAETAVEMVRGLRPVSFDWIDGEADRLGLVAEWTADAIPQAFAPGNEHDSAGIDYGSVTSVLTRAMQHVLERLEDIEQRLETT